MITGPRRIKDLIKNKAKGGVLISSLIGIDERTTRDIVGLAASR
ncbi:hypothetical protein AALA21_06280 [Eggerthellaceae bacterium 3-80]